MRRVIAALLATSVLVAAGPRDLGNDDRRKAELEKEAAQTLAKAKAEREAAAAKAAEKRAAAVAAAKKAAADAKRKAALAAAAAAAVGGNDNSNGNTISNAGGNGAAGKPDFVKPPRVIPVKTVPIAVPTKTPEPEERENFEPLQMKDADIPDYVSDEILYFSRAEKGRIEAIAAAAGVAILHIDSLEQIGLSMVTAKLKGGEDVMAVLSRLEEQGGVEFAQPNHVFQLLGNSRSKGYALHGIRSGSGSVQSGKIALIDSAVDTENTALVGADIEQELVGVRDKPEAHGTAIAELLVGTGDFTGVAKGAKLFSFAAFEPNKKQTWLSQSRLIAKALNNASRIRPDVANLSFGAKSNDRIMALLLDRMESQGTCVVSAAGNGNGSKVLFPGRYQSTLAVTAIDGGKRAYQYASRGPEIDTAAWGVDMNAAVPGGRRSVSGTSFATAVVSGSLLRLTQCNGDGDPAAMRKLVSGNAQDLGEAGHDEIFGAGLFQLNKTENSGSAEGAAPSRDEAKDGNIVPLLGGVAAALLAGLFLFIGWRRKKKQQAG